MSAISKLGSKVNGIADAVSDFDPIGGAIMKATNPMNLFGADSLSRGGGKAAGPGAPAMPGGDSIDEILARMSGNKKNSFDTSGVANTSTSMGKGGSSAGSSSGDGAGGAAAAGGAGGMGDMLKGIMGLVGQLLPLVMSFF